MRSVEPADCLVKTVWRGHKRSDDAFSQITVVSPSSFYYKKPLKYRVIKQGCLFIVMGSYQMLEQKAVLYLTSCMGFIFQQTSIINPLRIGSPIIDKLLPSRVIHIFHM